MKIQKRKKTKIIIPIAVLASVLIIAGAVLLYFYLNRGNSEATQTNQDNTSKPIHESDKKQSQDLRDNPDNKQQAPNTDQPSTPIVDDKTGKQSVQMTASSDQSNNTVFIRGGANYPVAGGSCYALLSGPSGQSIRKDTTVLQNPASTDCKTISVPVSELSTGEWTFTLNYTSDSYEGISNEVSFTI